MTVPAASSHYTQRVLLLQALSEHRLACEIRMPADVLSRLLVALLAQRSLSAPVHANACALAQELLLLPSTQALAGGGELPASASGGGDARGRFGGGEAPAIAAASLLQRLPSALLTETLSYMDAEFVVDVAFHVCRALRAHVCKGAVVNVTLVDDARLRRTVDTVPSSAWSGVQRCTVAQACPSATADFFWSRLYRGPLQALQLEDAAAQAPRVPAAVWPTLQKFGATYRPNWSLNTRRPSLGVSALPVLRRLALDCQLAGSKLVAPLLGLTLPGALRDLTLRLRTWDADKDTALRPLAPHLDALRIYLTPTRGYPVVRLSSMPHLRVLVVRAFGRGCWVEMAAASHPRLTALEVGGSAGLHIAGGGGGVWQAPRLRYLVVRTKFSDTTSALAAEGGHGVLEVLRVSTDDLRLLAQAGASVHVLHLHAEGHEAQLDDALARAVLQLPLLDELRVSNNCHVRKAVSSFGLSLSEGRTALLSPSEGQVTLLTPAVERPAYICGPRLKRIVNFARQWKERPPCFPDHIQWVHDPVAEWQDGNARYTLSDVLLS